MAGPFTEWAQQMFPCESEGHMEMSVLLAAAGIWIILIEPLETTHRARGVNTRARDGPSRPTMIDARHVVLVGMWWGALYARYSDRS